MSLINCKVELSLSWDPNCVLSSLVGVSTYAKYTDAKLYVPIVTLSIEDDAKLSKLLSKGFKRSVYQNKYKIIPNKTYDKNHYIRELLNASYQGVKRLFVLTYRDRGGAIELQLILTENIFFQEWKLQIATFNDGRNFYDQPINDLIKQYGEVTKVSTGQDDDYATGCLLDFAYFEKS